MRIFFIIILSTLGLLILNHLAKYGFNDAPIFIKIAMLIPLAGCWFMVFVFLVDIMHDRKG